MGAGKASGGWGPGAASVADWRNNSSDKNVHQQTNADQWDLLFLYMVSYVLWTNSIWTTMILKITSFTKLNT